MGVPMGTVKSYLFRGKAWLRDRLLGREPSRGGYAMTLADAYRKLPEYLDGGLLLTSGKKWRRLIGADAGAAGGVADFADA